MFIDCFSRLGNLAKMNRNFRDLSELEQRRNRSTKRMESLLGGWRINVRELKHLA